MPFIYSYPRPMLTVDVIIARAGRNGAEVLLIQRRHAPFEGQWALPGGFVDAGETLKHAAHRELQEETGLTGIDLEQLAAFGDPGRDPRGWTVSITFWGWLEPAFNADLLAGDDAAALSWWQLADLPPLAFDHGRIVGTFRERL